MTMVTRLIRVVHYKTKNSLNPSMRLSFDFTNKLNTLYTCKRRMDTKLSKVLTYFELLPPLKSHDTMIM